jgi:hypothetical protein
VKIHFWSWETLDVSDIRRQENLTNLDNLRANVRRCVAVPDYMLGTFLWTVGDNLGNDAAYGLKINLDADRTIFQYSHPFHIVPRSGVSSIASLPGTATSVAPLGGPTDARNSSSASEDSSDSQAGSSSGLGSGAIAGIVVGCLVLAAILAGLVYLVLYYRRKAAANSGLFDGGKAEMDGTGKAVVATTTILELEGPLNEMDAGPIPPQELEAPVSPVEMNAMSEKEDEMV